MESMDKMMSVILILIGIFVMYSAITGKGPAFKNEYPKAMKEEADKMLRTFCWIIGPITVVAGVLDYMLPEAWPYFISAGMTRSAIIV